MPLLFSVLATFSGSSEHFLRNYFQADGNLQTSSLESTNRSETPHPRLLLEVSEIPPREDYDASEDPFAEEPDDFASLSTSQDCDNAEPDNGKDVYEDILGSLT